MVITVIWQLNSWFGWNNPYLVSLLYRISQRIYHKPVSSFSQYSAIGYCGPDTFGIRNATTITPSVYAITLLACFVKPSNRQHCFHLQPVVGSISSPPPPLTTTAYKNHIPSSGLFAFACSHFASASVCLCSPRLVCLSWIQSRNEKTPFQSLCAWRRLNVIRRKLRNRIVFIYHFCFIIFDIELCP